MFTRCLQIDFHLVSEYSQSTGPHEVGLSNSIVRPMKLRCCMFNKVFLVKHWHDKIFGVHGTVYLKKNLYTHACMHIDMQPCIHHTHTCLLTSSLTHSCMNTRMNANMQPHPHTHARTHACTHAPRMQEYTHMPHTRMLARIFHMYVNSM